MKRRITISLEADLETVIRHKQANMLLKSNRSVSFSEMLNRLLHEALKQDEEIQIETPEEHDEASNPGSLKQKSLRTYSGMISAANRQSPEMKKSTEINSRLNKIYNRIS